MPMRDLIIGMCIAATLIAVFSIFGYEPREQEQRSGNVYFAVESGQQITPQPTDGTEPFVPSIEQFVPSTEPLLEVKTSDKRSETSDALAPTKSIDELAWEVILGFWSAGEERKQLLTEAGHDYYAVQHRVNELWQIMHEEE